MASSNEHYQGETFPISLTINEGLSAYARIVVWLYTSETTRVRFAYPHKDGYYDLSADGDVLSAEVRTEASAILCEGQIYVDVMCETTNGAKVVIARNQTGHKILKAAIKNEVE